MKPSNLAAPLIVVLSVLRGQVHADAVNPECRLPIPFLMYHPTYGLPQFLIDSNGQYCNSATSYSIWLKSWQDYDPSSRVSSFNRPMRWTWQSDPKHDVCNIDAAERVALGYPGALFRQLLVSNNLAGSAGSSGWNVIRKRLMEIKACPAALEEVQELKVDCFLREKPTSLNFMGGYMEYPDEPPKDIPLLVADVLGSMKNLTNLDIRVPNSSNSFKKAFAQSDASLASVARLTTDHQWAWLLMYTPKVNNLSISWAVQTMPWQGDWWASDSDKVEGMEILETIKTYGNVTELTVNMQWHPSWMKAPRVTSLHMHGTLSEIPYPSLEYNAKPLKNMLAILSGFAHLSHLTLPEAAGLGLGFDGGPDCGNAYTGASGRVTHRQVARAHMEAMEEALRLAIAALPCLESLQIGDEAANLTRANGSIVSASFAWTGKIEEILDESLPLDRDLWEF